MNAMRTEGENFLMPDSLKGHRLLSASSRPTVGAPQVPHLVRTDKFFAGASSIRDSLRSLSRASVVHSGPWRGTRLGDWAREN